MIERWIIEHREGNRWLTHNGFTGKSDSEDVLARSREDAMVFDSQESAKSWMKNIGILADRHNVLRAPPRDRNVQTGQALTEYSPW